MKENFQSSLCISGATLVDIFCVTAVVFNGLLLIVLWKDPTKSLRSTTTVYIASLSILQVSYGIIAGTAVTKSYIACAKVENAPPHLGRSFSRISLTFFIRVEILLILAFAVERLGNGAVPGFHQRGSYKAKNSLLCVGCIVLYSLCSSLFDLIAGTLWVRRLNHHLNIIPLVAIVVLTALLYCSLRKQNVQTENNCDVFLRERIEEGHTKRLEKQKLLTGAFFSIALLFVSTIIMYYVLSLYEVYCSDCWKEEWFSAALRISIAISFLHAALSPFVYYVFLPNVQRGLKLVLSGQPLQQMMRLTRLRRDHYKIRTVPVIYV